MGRTTYCCARCSLSTSAPVNAVLPRCSRFTLVCAASSSPTTSMSAPPLLITPDLIVAGTDDANAVTVGYLMCRFPELTLPASPIGADDSEVPDWRRVVNSLQSSAFTWTPGSEGKLAHSYRQSVSLGKRSAYPSQNPRRRRSSVGSKPPLGRSVSSGEGLGEWLAFVHRAFVASDSCLREPTSPCPQL
jgi:hypothetical protein